MTSPPQHRGLRPIVMQIPHKLILTPLAKSATMSPTPSVPPHAGAVAAPPANHSGFCPQRLQRIRAVLQTEVDRQRLPGAVVLVARGGQTALFESLGQQDPATGAPMARDAIFRIYSMTKPIVSVAVMMLAEQGR